MKNKHFRHRTFYKGVNEDLIFLHNYEWRINDKLKREGVYDYRVKRKLTRKIYRNEEIKYYVDPSFVIKENNLSDIIKNNIIVDSTGVHILSSIGTCNFLIRSITNVNTKEYEEWKETKNDDKQGSNK